MKRMACMATALVFSALAYGPARAQSEVSVRRARSKCSRS